VLAPFFTEILNRTQANWRVAVQTAIEYGVATPGFSSALSYFDSYRSANLPANLLQSQRDYFGAHTFERIDKPAGEFDPGATRLLWRSHLRACRQAGDFPFELGIRARVIVAH